MIEGEIFPEQNSTKFNAPIIETLIKVYHLNCYETEFAFKCNVIPDFSKNQLMEDYKIASFNLIITMKLPSFPSKVHDILYRFLKQRQVIPLILRIEQVHSSEPRKPT